MSPHLGICHICTCEGALTKEHIPPQKAFNDRTTISLRFEETINLGPEAILKGQKQQGGVWLPTLCAKCNNETGAWYASALVEWCYQSMSFLEKTNGKPSIHLPFRIKPLNILKQIAAMFLSVNDSNYALQNPDLVRFIKSKHQRYIDRRHRFYIFYNMSDKLKYGGIAALFNVVTREVRYFSEITFPPFGYVMTFDSNAPDPRLFDISFFSEYSYNETRDLYLKIPVLPVETYLPGIYPDKEEIVRAHEKFKLRNSI